MRYGRGALLVAIVVLLVSIGPAAWSQQVPRATCLDCHEGEGMEYAVLRSSPYVEIPTGEIQRFNVVVANPWLHDITSSLVRVNLTGSPAIGFETPDPLHKTENLTLSPGETRNVSFKVQTGATAVITRMQQGPDPSQRGLNDVDSSIWLADGTRVRPGQDGIRTGEPTERRLPGEPTPAQETELMVVDDDKLASTGTWNLSLERISGNPDETVRAEVHVLYNSTRVLSQRITETIGPGESANATFLVKGLERGNVTLSYTVQMTAFFNHPSGVQSQDEGNTTMSGEASFAVGDELSKTDAGPAVPATPPINWKMNARIWGEATGFIGLFMVPLALVLGGAFGRRNVLWVNKIATSARLRVLWHNALSFILLGVSIIHLILFLYEPVYDWSVGMVWGGLGTLALIGLGITGGFQRQIARSIGYAKWRLLHIAMASIFVASVLAHVVVDGAHFDFLRDWLGFT